MKDNEAQPTTTYLPPYEGNDMAGYALAQGLKLSPAYYGTIRSITNVRDTAVIVTDWAVLWLRPCQGSGFSVEVAAHLHAR